MYICTIKESKPNIEVIKIIVFVFLSSSSKSVNLKLECLIKLQIIITIEYIITIRPNLYIGIFCAWVVEIFKEDIYIFAMIVSKILYINIGNITARIDLKVEILKITFSSTKTKA